MSQLPRLTGMTEIKNIISDIEPLDQNSIDKCRLRLDNLIKPLGSLHSLEHIAAKTAGIFKNPRPQNLKKSVVIMAADHGAALEKISAYPQEATALMAKSIAEGASLANTFAAHAGASLVLADIGIAGDLDAGLNLLNVKIARGTANIAHAAAMTEEQAIRAIKTGIKIAEKELAKGANVIGLGEIGVGNTTIAAAIVAACSQLPAASLVGVGSGVSEDTLKRKIHIIEKALLTNKPAQEDAFDILTKVGGFEIAGLVGVILAAAKGRAVIVLDGAATSAAALLAVKLAPEAKNFLIASHYSDQPCHKKALEIIGIPAYLNLNLCLGQGAGAMLGMSLLKASLHVLNDMKTFGETGVITAQDGPGVLRQSKNLYS